MQTGAQQYAAFVQGNKLLTTASTAVENEGEKMESGTDLQYLLLLLGVPGGCHPHSLLF